VAPPTAPLVASLRTLMPLARRRAADRLAAPEVRRVESCIVLFVLVAPVALWAAAVEIVPTVSAMAAPTMREVVKLSVIY
jgi:hypothetical protein